MNLPVLLLGGLVLTGAAFWIVRVRLQHANLRKQLMIIAKRILDERLKSEVELLTVRAEHKQLVITLLSIVECQDKILAEYRKKAEEWE